MRNIKNMDAALILCLLGAAAWAQAKDKLAWMKYNQARVFAMSTGKPILVVCPPDGGVSGMDAGGNIDGMNMGGGVDIRFIEDLNRQNARQFLLVKAMDQNTMKAVKGTAGSAIVQDPDGETIARGPANNLGELEKVVDEGLKKYVNKPITWETYPGNLDAYKDSKKLVILAFVLDGKESDDLLKALEDRWIAKLHAKCVFLKATFEKDSPENKKWGFSTAPNILLADPSKEAGPKATIDRYTSKKTVPHLKNMIEKALRKIEKGG